MSNETLTRALCIGECMIELAPASAATGDGNYLLSFAGDTFNTAVYLKRLLGDLARVSFMTALGDDSLSARMQARFRDEDLETDLVRVLPGEQPGLYLIENDGDGERYFQYWRAISAARAMLDGISEAALVQILQPFDLIYLSGITLAILKEEQRHKLFHALEQLSNDRIIAFDPNYRPAMWLDSIEAQRSFQTMAGIATTVLTTLDDDRLLWEDCDPEHAARRWLSWGCGEVVVKNGAEGCLVMSDLETLIVPACANIHPVDTTGAGDSFCAGYLSARWQGRSTQESAATGHVVAATVVVSRGAIVSKGEWFGALS